MSIELRSLYEQGYTRAKLYQTFKSGERSQDRELALRVAKLPVKSLPTSVLIVNAILVFMYLLSAVYACYELTIKGGGSFFEILSYVVTIGLLYLCIECHRLGYYLIILTILLFFGFLSLNSPIVGLLLALYKGVMGPVYDTLKYGVLVATVFQLLGSIYILVYAYPYMNIAGVPKRGKDEAYLFLEDQS